MQKKEEIIKTLKNESSHLVHALNTTKQCRSMNKQLEKLYTPMSIFHGITLVAHPNGVIETRTQILSETLVMVRAGKL